MRAGLRYATVKNTTLRARALQRFRGRMPTHWFDLARNRALFNGVDVGPISSIPNLTGTLNLVPGVGHRVATAANILKITSPGVTYPCTLGGRFTRSADTGAAEVVLTTSFGADILNSARIGISGADLATALSIAVTTQAAETVGAVVPVGFQLPVAGRFGANDVRVASFGALSVGDTVATLPTTPDTLSIGGTNVDTLFLTGDIAEVFVFNSLASDYDLQVLGS